MTLSIGTNVGMPLSGRNGTTHRNEFNQGIDKYDE